MGKMYLTHERHEKNASNGLRLHDTPEAAADAAGEAIGCGAIEVRLFECTEVEFEHYTAVRIIPKEPDNG